MHSTHAHPLPDGWNTCSSQFDSSHCSSAIISPTTLASQQQNEGLSHQTRRLQLRNAGFRGATFPTRRISPFFTTSSTTVEAISHQVSNENSSLSAEKRSMYGEALPPSPVNILQEIQRSTRKKRSSPRPGLGAIFQDSTQTEESNGASEISWYEEGSRNCSPAALAATSVNMMKLREVSGNQKTPPPPLSSPLTKQVKGRNFKRIDLRSASSEASKYIEHLESQLTSANAKLDSLTSPNTNKLRSAKLRALTVDNRNLRQDLAAWEKKFAARVQEERDQRLEVEMELRMQLRTLENDIELKDARIAELEWEIESMRVKVGDAEGLEVVNIGLEKRIEVLTNLLVHSSNKLDVYSTATSPVRADPIKRTPRPKSMLSGIPSPSGGVRMSLPTVSESAFWQPSNIGSSSNIVESPEDAVQGIDGQNSQSPTYNEAMRSPGYRRQSRQSGSFESRSRTSGSFRSAPSSASRPTSFRSSGSFGPTSSVVPHLADVDVRSANKQRKMRKFPSGSVSLRPLILPAATVMTSLPASAPVYPSIEATARRDISEVSLDPTTSFLSKPVDSSPITTPDQPGRHRSTSWAQEQTLKALEGRFTDIDRLTDEQASPSIDPTSEEKLFGFGEISSEDRKRPLRPRSLQKELEEAENEQAGQAQPLASSEPFEDGLIPVYTNESPKESPKTRQFMIGIDPTPSKPPPPAAHSRRMRLLIESEDTPKLKEIPPALAYTASQPLRATPSTHLTTQHAFGIFSRLTNLISHTKQDPFVLARRLLSNAWAQGSKRLGGIGWWLLGLVYGTRWRKRKRTADSGTVEPTTTQDFDWHHFTAEASRSRTAEHYFRDYGACHQRPDSWLSPPHASAPHQIPSNNTTPPFPPSPSPKRRPSPHLIPCPDCVEPSSRRTFRLWLHFSLAIVLAVGMAIKHGPATLLSPDPDPGLLPIHTHDSLLHPTTTTTTKPNRERLAPEREPLLQAHRSRSRHHRDSADGGYARGTVPSSRVNSVASNGVDSGYGSITFAETLGPADFEAMC
ncbi:hypothetical protein IMSHALPRED_001163 [Imshaugia aleurites]|uniref:Uncharacterized protein n=1 Tax=Imshaugia aleurites TaxID=172621 RepID=A0A8H3J1H7_9LECA|nr:hypothetical protein IMSHALPRED_001163 [Imshaugia aleurites]